MDCRHIQEPTVALHLLPPAPVVVFTARMYVFDGSEKGYQSALAVAISNGHVDIVRLLLAAHADANSKDAQGLTAFDWARMSKKSSIRSLLKQYRSRNAADRH